MRKVHCFLTDFEIRIAFGPVFTIGISIAETLSTSASTCIVHFAEVIRPAIGPNVYSATTENIEWIEAASWSLYTR